MVGLLSCHGNEAINGPSRCNTHQCKQAASSSCSLKHPLCTHTCHLGFVGNVGRWDVLSHFQQLASPYPCHPSAPVGLVGRTTLLKLALVLWVAHKTLSQTSQRLVSRSMLSQTGQSHHIAGKLLTLKKRECVNIAANTAYFTCS